MVLSRLPMLIVGPEWSSGSEITADEPSERDRIVLPHTFLPELAKYTDDVLNHEQFHAEVKISPYR